MRLPSKLGVWVLVLLIAFGPSCAMAESLEDVGQSEYRLAEAQNEAIAAGLESESAAEDVAALEVEVEATESEKARVTAELQASVSELEAKALRFDLERLEEELSAKGEELSAARQEALEADGEREAAEERARDAEVDRDVALGLYESQGSLVTAGANMAVPGSGFPVGALVSMLPAVLALVQRTRAGLA